METRCSKGGRAMEQTRNKKIEMNEYRQSSATVL